MRFHWQNLDTKSVGRREVPLGRGWLHGRAWFGLLGDPFSAPTMHVEWCLGNRARFASIEFFVLANEDDCGFHLCIPHLFSLYFAFRIMSFKASHRLLGILGLEYAEDWVTQISIYDKALRVELFNPRWGGWDSKKKWWQQRDWSVYPLDILFGRLEVIDKKELINESVQIAMPEKTYDGTCKIEYWTWKRARLPFKYSRCMCNVDIPEGIPEPGKGENSWDCGQDAIYGQSNDASSVAEAIARVVEGVLKTREKRGGKNWEPK